ncbi:hypothetical protein CCUS01_00011 [Colletotrichum cuscutae]|uniref:Uncharacterized protein n=1 Tax=Colletotrichum cuscutae TaxID=1209917 RepID=A0AAJ0DQJ4_9PEZI|nr:hypothetical protein CCUS01_00011 [Colletotrichum cuscutae]
MCFSDSMRLNSHQLPANETKLLDRKSNSTAVYIRSSEAPNRCTRSGGIESRCDSKKSQVGRPRIRKQDASPAVIERASRSRSPGTSTSSRLVPLEDAQQDVRLEALPTDGTLQFDFDNSASSSSASSHAAAHFNQYSWEVDLSQSSRPPFPPQFLNGRTIPIPRMEEHVGLSPQLRNDTVSSSSGKGDVNGTTDTLIRMQGQLQQLLFDSGHEASPVVDEILGLTNHLLEILQTQIQINSNTEQPARQTNRITTLQIMTCYSYIVQLLHPIINTTTRSAHTHSNQSNK